MSKSRIFLFLTRILCLSWHGEGSWGSSQKSLSKRSDITSLSPNTDWNQRTETAQCSKHLNALYSLIEHVVHWLKIDRNLYGQLRQKFQAHKNKKQMDKTGYNGCDPFRQCMYKWFYHIRQHNMRTSSPNQQIMYFFLQSLQLPLYLYEAYDFIRQLTVNICAIFCCCGIEQWFSMDRMTG